MVEKHPRSAGPGHSAHMKCRQQSGHSVVANRRWTAEPQSSARKLAAVEEHPSCAGLNKSAPKCHQQHPRSAGPGNSAHMKCRQQSGHSVLANRRWTAEPQSSARKLAAVEEHPSCAGLNKSAPKCHQQGGHSVLARRCLMHSSKQRRKSRPRSTSAGGGGGGVQGNLAPARCADMAWARRAHGVVCVLHTRPTQDTHREPRKICEKKGPVARCTRAARRRLPVGTRGTPRSLPALFRVPLVNLTENVKVNTHLRDDFF